jgi:hypothetical protein
MNLLDQLYQQRHATPKLLFTELCNAEVYNMISFTNNFDYTPYNFSKKLKTPPGEH